MSSRCCLAGLISSANPFHLADASGSIPVLNVKITVFVKAEPVRCGEDSWFLLCWFDGKLGPLCFIGIIADEGDDVAFLVENGNSGLELGHRAVVTMKRDSAGTAQPSSVFTDPISF